MSEDSISPVTSRTFTDPDELEADFKRQSVHVVQLNLEPLQLHSLNLQFDGGTFSFRKLCNPLRVLGEKRADFFVFEFLMASDTDALISHGTQIPIGTLYGFDSTRGVDMVLPAQTVMASLTVKRQLVQDYLEVTGRTDLDDRFFATNAVQSPDCFSSVQQYLRELYGLFKQRSPLLKQPQIHKLLMDDYIPLLIDSIPVADGRKRNSADLARSRLVQDAEAYMLTNLEQPLTLRDLCQILGASKSPISQGFREVFGTSPMAYLKVLRLHAIHKTLKAADPSNIKVIDVAHRFGFWHTGRLSQEYKQMFGKSPSETLQQ